MTSDELWHLGMFAAAMAVVTIIAMVVIWLCLIGTRSHRKQVLTVVQLGGKPAGDDWQRVQIWHWPGHVLVWVPRDLATAIVTGRLDLMDSGDLVARIWHGTLGDVYDGSRLIRYHIRTGRRG